MSSDDPGPPPVYVFLVLIMLATMRGCFHLSEIDQKLARLIAAQEIKK